MAAAAGAVLAVLIGAGAALWQARVATAERERAEQVKEFIASIMRDADPYARESGEPVDATDLLKTARSRVDRELADQPMVRLELLGIIGESFYGLRDNAAAAESLEEALRAAAAAPGADAGLYCTCGGCCRRPTHLSAARRTPAGSSNSSSMRTGPVPAHPIRS